MPSPLALLTSLSVTAKVAALGAAGLLATSLVGGLALVEMHNVRQDSERLSEVQAASALVLRLDTRASELKVDAYKSILRKDPAGQIEELQEDIAKPKELLAELEGIDLHGDAAAAVKVVADEYDSYMAAVEAFVDGAVKDQRSARARWEEIQQANDKTDDAIDSAKDVFTAQIEAQHVELVSSSGRTAQLVVLVLLAGLILVTAVGAAVSRAIVRPLRRCVAGLDAVAEGDLTTRVEIEGRDELSHLGSSLNRTVEVVRDAVRLMGASAGSLSASSQQMSAAAATISVSAEEASAQANVVAAAAEQVSRNVQSVATGSDEMGASIREIAQNATDAAQVAAGAVGVAASTNATISKLGESSTEIGNVVKVITSIAEQTNLLALNATIEAARAGEAGKGFAVVANEVKELAQETARATEDISRRVEAIQADTAGAVSAIAEISEVIERINDFQVTISSAVEEQTATTNAMNRSVTEAATGSTEIAANITGVARAAATTTEGVSQSQHTAAELARLSTQLEEVCRRFVF